MPHCIRRAVLSLLALALLAAPRAAESESQRPDDIIDGAGMINYMQRPDFKVGTWVKYRTVGKSEQGLSDDYTVTILIGGEEMWWGEPCFWVETRTLKANGRERVTASLVSYSAFGDSLAESHLLWFVRKTINGLKQDGQPEISLYTRGRTEVQLRREVWAKEDNPTLVDSLGTESVTVPAGTFDTYKVRHRYGMAETAEQGDSTVYYRRQLDRIFYWTAKVPFTQLAKIDVDDHQEGKTWEAGKFEKGPLKTLERARGKTELIAFGSSGMTPLLVPVGSRGSIDRKLVEAALEETRTSLASASRGRGR